MCPGVWPGVHTARTCTARQVQGVAVVQQHVGFGQAEHAEHVGEVGVELGHDLGGRPAAGQPGAGTAGPDGLADPGRQGLDLGGVHRDPSPRCIAEAAAEPVVVEVNVGDDDPGDPVGRQARGLEPGQQVLPAALGIPARVHDNRAGVGKQQVSERVAERVIRHRHRHGPYAGADLLNRRQLARSPGLTLSHSGDRYRATGRNAACRGALAPRHVQTP